MRSTTTAWIFLVSLGTLAPLSAVAEPKAQILYSECPFLLEPSRSSRVVCRPPRGTEVTARRADGVWHQVETKTCNGFVPSACLRNATTFGTFRRDIAEDPNREVEADEERQPHHRVTLGVGGVFSYAALSGSGAPAGDGIGYGGHLRLGIPLGPRWEMALTTGYETLRLVRSAQQNLYFGEGGLHFRFRSAANEERHAHLGVEFGLTGLFRLRSDDTVGGINLPLDETASGVLALFSFGPAIDIPFGHRAGMLLNLDAYYNVLSPRRSLLFGGRVLATVFVGL